jgi:hypothetical protein
VLSSLAVASGCPSGPNATLRTQSSWVIWRSWVPVVVSQIRSATARHGAGKPRFLAKLETRRSQPVITATIVVPAGKLPSSAKVKIPYIILAT